MEIEIRQTLVFQSAFPKVNYNSVKNEPKTNVQTFWKKPNLFHNLRISHFINQNRVTNNHNQNRRNTDV